MPLTSSPWQHRQPPQEQTNKRKSNETKVHKQMNCIMAATSLVPKPSIQSNKYNTKLPTHITKINMISYMQFVDKIHRIRTYAHQNEIQMQAFAMPCT